MNLSSADSRFSVQETVMKPDSRIYFFLLLILSLFAPKAAICLDAPSEKKWTKTDSIFIQELVNLAWDKKTLDVDFAVNTAQKAVALSKQIDFQQGEANGLHALGVVYWYQLDLSNALHYFLEALGIRQAINDQLGLGRSYNNIGNIYFEITQYDTALVYYQKALSIREKLQDTLGLIFSLSNIGDIYLKEGAIQKAYDFYIRSKDLAVASKDAGKLSYIKGQLGDFALKKGWLTQAQTYWNESLVLARQSGDKRQIAKCLCKTTELALQTKDIDLPTYEVRIRKALSLAEEIKNIAIQGDAILLLAEIATLKGNYNETSAYKQAYQQLMSALWLRQEGKAINEVNINFETRRLTKDLIEKEETLSLQLSQLWVFLAAISFFLIFIMVLNYRNRYAEQLKLTETIKEEMQKVADKNQALQQSNEVLEKFAFAASHDLKEPLRNIGAFTDLLNRRNSKYFKNESKEYISFIVKATSQMHQVLDDLLDFVRLTHPPAKAMEKVDMSIVFSNWMSKNQAVLEEQHINIKIASLPIVQAYPGLMADLTAQLLHNAIKFHKPGAVINIEVGYQSTSQMHIFSIKDNGIGINQAYQKKIFETFQRLNKHHFTGTGIGLSLCKRIIRHHNGRLWVESEEGKGSCFYFSLYI